MKKIFQILLFISAVACFTSCDDVNNNPDPSEAYDVAPEMKIYFDSFKKGSWWVLTSDITNRKDSIVVDSVERYLDQGIAERPTWIYAFYLKVFSSKSSYNNIPFYLTYGTKAEGTLTDIITSDNNYMYFDLDYGSIVQKYWSKSQQIFPIDITQNGVFYQNVISPFGAFCPNCFTPDHCNFYFAPNIGFLKFESQTDTLTLKNYFIP